MYLFFADTSDMSLSKTHFRKVCESVSSYLQSNQWLRLNSWIFPVFLRVGNFATFSTSPLFLMVVSVLGTFDGVVVIWWNDSSLQSKWIRVESLLVFVKVLVSVLVAMPVAVAVTMFMTMSMTMSVLILDHFYIIGLVTHQYFLTR